jgi:hypothetical protein
MPDGDDLDVPAPCPRWPVCERVADCWWPDCGERPDTNPEFGCPAV